MPTPDLIQGVPLPTYDDPAAIPDDLANVFYANLSRGIPRFSTTAQRDAAYPSPVDGQHCWIAADSTLYVRSGGSWRILWRAGRDGTWQPYTPTTSWPLGTGGATVGHYARTGDVVSFGARITLGAGGLDVSGGLSISLPVPVANLPAYAVVRLNDASAAGAAGRRWAFADLSGTTATPLDAAGATIGGGTPWAWATGDTVSLSGTYRAA